MEGGYKKASKILIVGLLEEAKLFPKPTEVVLGVSVPKGEREQSIFVKCALRCAVRKPKAMSMLCSRFAKLNARPLEQNMQDQLVAFSPSQTKNIQGALNYFSYSCKD